MRQYWVQFLFLRVLLHRRRLCANIIRSPKSSYARSRTVCFQTDFIYAMLVKQLQINFACSKSLVGVAVLLLLLYSHALVALLAWCCFTHPSFVASLTTGAYARIPSDRRDHIPHGQGPIRSSGPDPLRGPLCRHRHGRQHLCAPENPYFKPENKKMKPEYGASSQEPTSQFTSFGCRFPMETYARNPKIEN